MGIRLLGLSLALATYSFGFESPVRWRRWNIIKSYWLLKQRSAFIRFINQLVIMWNRNVSSKVEIRSLFCLNPFEFPYQTHRAKPRHCDAFQWTLSQYARVTDTQTTEKQTDRQHLTTIAELCNAIATYVKLLTTTVTNHNTGCNCTNGCIKKTFSTAFDVKPTYYYVTNLTSLMTFLNHRSKPRNEYQRCQRIFCALYWHTIGPAVADV